MSIDINIDVLKELNPNAENITLVIDGTNLFIINMAKNYGRLTNEEGLDTSGLYNSITKFFSILKELNPDKIVTIFDNKGSAMHKSLYKGYKAQRQIQWRRRFTTDEEHIEWKTDFAREIHLFKQFMEFFGANIYSLEFVEGDFIISLYIKFMFENTDDIFILVSTDKDFTQLLGFYPRFVIYNPIKHQFITPFNYKEYIKLDIPVELILLAKVFLGDKSDFIPNVKGFGEKTVEKILKTLYEKYGVELVEKSMEEIVRLIDENMLLSEKKQQILNEALKEKLLDTNKKLMDLLHPSDMIATDKLQVLYNTFNLELQQKHIQKYSYTEARQKLYTILQKERYNSLLEKSEFIDSYMAYFYRFQTKNPMQIPKPQKNQKRQNLNNVLYKIQQQKQEYSNKDFNKRSINIQEDSF